MIVSRLINETYMKVTKNKNLSIIKLTKKKKYDVFNILFDKTNQKDRIIV